MSVLALLSQRILISTTLACTSYQFLPGIFKTKVTSVFFRHDYFTLPDRIVDIELIADQHGPSKFVEMQGLTKNSEEKSVPALTPLRFLL